MSLVYYTAPLSPYAKAVNYLLFIAKIEHEVKFIHLLKGDNLTPEYTQLNPNQSVPFITEGDFKLFESHAIMRYLVNRDNLQQYYGKDLHQKAQIDCYLDWHQNGTKKLFKYCIDFGWFPVFRGTPIPENKEQRLKEVHEKLEFFQSTFLNNGEYNYIFNHEGPSIADFAALSFFTALFITNFDYSQFPAIEQYISRLLKNDHLREADIKLGSYDVYKNMELNNFIKSLLE